MQEWQEDHLSELEGAEDKEAMFLALSKLACSLDFEFCTYVLRLPVPLSAPAMLVTTNYPQEWQRKYYENNYLAIDPVLRRAMCDPGHVVWNERMFDEAPEFYEDACSEGVRYGWSQHCRGANNMTTLLSLARSSGPITPSELQAKRFKLAWLAQAAQLGAARHALHELMPFLGEDLSEREQSVLRWTAEGKNSEDIADILRISKRTVDFHANNAIAKLGVSNRTAAAVRAAMLGLI